MSSDLEARATKQMAELKEQLEKIRKDLQELKTHKHGPEFLYPIQERLREIDAKRVDGKFMFDKQIPAGQAELVNMIEECYGIAYEVQNGMRAMQHELHNVNQSLHELKLKEGKPTYTQLAPLQDRLLQVSEQLKEAKYQNEKGEIPPGQAKLFDLLNNCYELKGEIASKIEQRET